MFFYSNKSKTENKAKHLQFARVNWKDPQECINDLHATAFDSDTMVCAGNHVSKFLFTNIKIAVCLLLKISNRTQVHV